MEEIIYLNEVASKEKFQLDILKFLNVSKKDVLVIFVNPIVDSQRRLDLTISLINECRGKQKFDAKDKHIVLLIRIVMENRKRLYHNEGWQIYTLDYLSYENSKNLLVDRFEH